MKNLSESQIFEAINIITFELGNLQKNESILVITDNETKHLVSIAQHQLNQVSA